jgi:hypothetical protein
VESSPLLLQPFIGLLYQSWMIDGDDYGASSGMNEWPGKLKYLEETCPLLLCPPKIPRLKLGLEVGPPRWEADDQLSEL